ncbi:MAG: hypothetical protein R3C11_19550 [Planctomycetaceae bacterium]
MTPLALADNRVLLTYNRRFGDQGVVAAIVSLEDAGWKLETEQILYDAGLHKKREQQESGSLQDELDTFAFGFPTPLRLTENEFLATHWSVEQGKCGIRWTRFRISRSAFMQIANHSSTSLVAVASAGFKCVSIQP